MTQAFASVTDFLDSELAISEFGQIVSYTITPFTSAAGFSGSTHERIAITNREGETNTIVTKRIRPSLDATLWRSGTPLAREIYFLSEPRLDGFWDIFECPYLGIVRDGEESTIIMRDLDAYLFPDVREPISKEDEALFVKSLAALHAKYWNQDFSDLTWLANAEDFFNFLPPTVRIEEEKNGRTHKLFDAVDAAWATTLELLPPDLREFVCTLPKAGRSLTKGMTPTLLHGDLKIANFACMPGGQLAAFDFTVISRGTPAVEIGWYLAVNATRLCASKEEFLTNYRSAMSAFDVTFSDSEWSSFQNVATLLGASTLLWTKGSNLKKGLPGAHEEWTWWCEKLGAIKPWAETLWSK